MGPHLFPGTNITLGTPAIRPDPYFQNFPSISAIPRKFLSQRTHLPHGSQTIPLDLTLTSGSHLIHGTQPIPRKPTYPSETYLNTGPNWFLRTPSNSKDHPIPRNPRYPTDPPIQSYLYPTGGNLSLRMSPNLQKPTYSSKHQLFRRIPHNPPNLLAPTFPRELIQPAELNLSLRTPAISRDTPIPRDPRYPTGTPYLKRLVHPMRDKISHWTRLTPWHPTFRPQLSRTDPS